MVNYNINILIFSKNIPLFGVFHEILVLNERGAESEVEAVVVSSFSWFQFPVVQSTLHISISINIFPNIFRQKAIYFQLEFQTGEGSLVKTYST